jgi:hypothetical protein
MNIHVSNSLSHPLSVIVATVTMLALTLPGLARATPDAAVAETIEYLIASVSESDLTFIRNGKRYAGNEAAEHMRKKYDYFDDDIVSAEDFIRLAATRSLMSGKPYYVVLADGTRTKTADWLGTRLGEYRLQMAEQALAQESENE